MTIIYIIGEANGSLSSQIFSYVEIGKNPRKYLDIDTFLPPRSELQADFVWVKPSEMPKEQVLAWVRHLYARQDRKDKGEDIVVFAFNKIMDQVEAAPEKEKLKPARSIEEYVDELDANIFIYRSNPWPLQTRDGRPAPGPSSGRPYIPGEEQDEEDGIDPDEVQEVAPAVTQAMVFETGSPGLVPAEMKERLAFIESLSSNPALRRLVVWLRVHKVL